MEKIKAFRGSLTSDFLNQISEFASQTDVTAKSIGGGIVRTSFDTIITIGFTEEPNTKKIIIETIQAGNAKEAWFDRLQDRLTEIVDSHDNIICHEILIDEKFDIYVLIMKVV